MNKRQKKKAGYKYDRRIILEQGRCLPRHPYFVSKDFDTRETCSNVIFRESFGKLYSRLVYAKEFYRLKKLGIRAKEWTCNDAEEHEMFEEKSDSFHQAYNENGFEEIKDDSDV